MQPAPATEPPCPPEVAPGAARIYCNRTLNLHRIQAIGYDMDYTLIHYWMQTWEGRAFEHLKERLAANGWPVQRLAFDPDQAMRGLIIDTERGNVVKANRFGYGKTAYHGTRQLSFAELREVYERVLIDVTERRWQFLNTLFSISEACMYMQLVDLLDRGELPAKLDYEDLYQIVRRSIDETHLEGKLKAEIISDPASFVALDPEMPLALLDQKMAGKKLLLITNSEWTYAAPMLDYAINPFLPEGLTWKDLFDIAIVGARKPDFFSARMPVFEVVSADGLLREHFGPLLTGHVYHGGNAALVEESLGLHGEEILYVGDHIEVDVGISKSILRWRTALILRELEQDIAATAGFREHEAEIGRLMAQKEALEAAYAHLKLSRQRKRKQYGPAPADLPAGWQADLRRLRDEMAEIDARIIPLAEAAGRLHNPNWGMLMRMGNDKSYLARQVETFADIYMARVSDFAASTPFAYFRSHRGSLPHD